LILANKHLNHKGKQMSFILILLGVLVIPTALSYAFKFGGFLFEGLSMFLGGLIFLGVAAAGAIGLLSVLFG
jgi:hypothetical protein